MSSSLRLTIVAADACELSHIMLVCLLCSTQVLQIATWHITSSSLYNLCKSSPCQGVIVWYTKHSNSQCKSLFDCPLCACIAAASAQVAPRLVAFLLSERDSQFSDTVQCLNPSFLQKRGGVVYRYYDSPLSLLAAVQVWSHQMTLCVWLAPHTRQYWSS